MEEDDSFKCSLCVFLLKENESLRNQLFETSNYISAQNSEKILVDGETQTDTNVKLSTNGVTDNTGSMKSLEETCQTSCKNHNNSTIVGHGNETQDSLDELHPQLGDNSELSANSLVRNPFSAPPGDPTNSPFIMLPDSPFAEFDLFKLVQETKFVPVGKREVKYYGKYSYSYGKTVHSPSSIPKNSHISSIVKKVELLYPKQSFNSVLVTKFADGQSYLPLHSDNEADIEADSLILTVSLGATRKVNFQRKNNGHTEGVLVNHGDAYLMSTGSQAHFKHGVPRDFGKRTRVSLTFRKIRPPADSLSKDSGDSETVADPTNSQISVANFLDELKGTPDHSTCINHSTSEILSKDQCVDTLYISSSMFRHLKENELCSNQHSSTVLYYPGATAGNILKSLKADSSFNNIEPTNIKKIYLLCGTNNVDKILGVPKNLHNCADIDMRNFNGQNLDNSFVEIEHLVSFLQRWSPSASLSILNILPRASYARNSVINKLNGFIHYLCCKEGHTFINTELNRNLYSNKQGYRKNEYFHVNGSDNVHLNSSGVIRLGKLLKYLMHLR